MYCLALVYYETTTNTEYIHVLVNGINPTWLISLMST